jgi:hypothetical protein
MATIRQSLMGATIREAPQSSTRFDWIMVLLSAWWVGGSFLDGWAHNHLDRLETFFTPWHAVLYSGFLAVALFLLVTAVMNRVQGHAWTQVMPHGYGLSLLGIGIFAAGGVLDMLWHLLFGIEQSIAALLSPTHLVLLVGGVLTVSGPLRAAWQRPTASQQQTLFDRLPTILSLAYILASIIFFTQYANPIIHPQANRLGIPVESRNDSIAWGVVSILFQTAALMGVALFALRRWQLPIGTFTILYGLNSTLAITQGNLSLLPVVAVVSLLAGLLVDLLYTVLKPTVERKEALHLFAFLAPIVIQTTYFLTLLATSGVVWEVNLWMGSIILSGMVGLLLSFLLA